MLTMLKLFVNRTLLNGLGRRGDREGKPASARHIRDSSPQVLHSQGNGRSAQDTSLSGHSEFARNGKEGNDRVHDPTTEKGENLHNNQ